MRLSMLAFAAVLLVAPTVLVPHAFAASGEATERNLDRVTNEKDAEDDNQSGANPCKGITKSSTRAKKKACADFMQQQ
jgi:hypothetical protein